MILPPIITDHREDEKEHEPETRCKSATPEKLKNEDSYSLYSVPKNDVVLHFSKEITGRYRDIKESGRDV